MCRFFYLCLICSFRKEEVRVLAPKVKDMKVFLFALAAMLPLTLLLSFNVAPFPDDASCCVCIPCDEALLICEDEFCQTVFNDNPDSQAFLILADMDTGEIIEVSSESSGPEGETRCFSNLPSGISFSALTLFIPAGMAAPEEGNCLNEGNFGSFTESATCLVVYEQAGFTIAIQASAPGVCGIQTLNVTGAPAGSIFNWNTGQEGQTIQINSSQNQIFEVIATAPVSGCNAVDQIFIPANSLSVSLNSSSPSCPTPAGPAQYNINSIVTGGSGSYSYAWSNSMVTPAITVSSPVPFPNPAPTPLSYSLTVTDQLTQCTAMATTGPLALPPPLSVTINNPMVVCPGQPAIITAVPMGGTPPYMYSWSPNGGSGQSATIFGAVAPTTYTVTVTDAAGCQATDNTIVCLQLHGFSSQVVPELIYKIPDGSDPNAYAECLGGELLDVCSCDSLILVGFAHLDPQDDCFFLQIEKDTKSARRRLDVEGDGPDVNSRFVYCDTPADSCVVPNDNTIDNAVLIGQIDSGIDSAFPSIFSHNIEECGAGNSDGFSSAGNILYDHTGTNSIQDSIGHGSHLANIIIQNPSDALAIMPHKVVGGSSSENSLFNAICALRTIHNYNEIAAADPTQEEVKVINFSMGYWGPESRHFKEAIEQLQTQEVILVTSAGNDGADMDESTKTQFCEGEICEADSSTAIVLGPADITLLPTEECPDSLQLNISGSANITVPFSFLLDTLDEDAYIDSFYIAIDSICETIVVETQFDHYPSEFPFNNIISVGAWDDGNQTVADFSTTGATSVDLMASGVGIVSEIPCFLTDNNACVEVQSGTSQSAAFVSREIARICAENPTFNSQQVISEIKDNRIISDESLTELNNWGGYLQTDIDLVGDCE